MESKVVYDVVVDEAGLNWEQAGPLFDRYAVNLTGRLDRRWADCYQRITVSSPSFSRFRLDPGASTVTFTCRSSDGPVEVMGVLKRLQDLLTRVNNEAGSEAAARPAPSAKAEERPNRATSIAAGLLSRLTRH